MNTTPDTLHPARPEQARDLPYRSRLRRRSALAPGIWLLGFERPAPITAAVAPWQFASGQHVTLGMADRPDLPLRPYSIASPPLQDGIDLHVRDTGHGMSHALATLAIGEDVAFSAGAGTSVPAHAQDRPLLLLAGGVGIAPMVSIVGARSAHMAQCHLYWGVAQRDHLYLHDHWLAQRAAGLLHSYHPLTESAAAPLRAGMIGPAVIHDLPDLSDFAVYLAGPAAMVAATLPLLAAHGAQKEYVFGDGITI